MSKAVNLKLYRVDDSYLDYLRQVDSRVPINKDSGKARPFVGILHFVRDTPLWWGMRVVNSS